jgi:hypothetical protein
MSCLNQMAAGKDRHQFLIREIIMANKSVLIPSGEVTYTYVCTTTPFPKTDQQWEEIARTHTPVSAEVAALVRLLDNARYECESLRLQYKTLAQQSTKLYNKDQQTNDELRQEIKAVKILARAFSRKFSGSEASKSENEQASHDWTRFSHDPKAPLIDYDGK